MRVEVVVSLGPRRVLIVQLACADPLTAAQAKERALLQLGLDSSHCADWRLAVWGKSVNPNHSLCEGDRLELLRPLVVDPKEARRLRFNQQGSRAAGLFAKRRQGAKTGY